MDMHAVTSPPRISADTPASPAQDHVRERHGDALWRVRADYRDEVLGPGAPNWFALENDTQVLQVKKGHGRAVWHVHRGDHGFYVKVYEDRSPMKRWFARRSTEREWRAGNEALARAIPVATPIACGVRRERSAFISLALDNAQPLADRWNQVCGGIAARAHRSTVGELVRSVARLMAVAHERGLSLRDNHANNIIVARRSSRDVEARFVDLLGASIGRGPVTDRVAAASLAALDQHFQRVATRSQRLSFLRQYLAARGGVASTDGRIRRRLDHFLPLLIQAKRRHGITLARRRDRRLRGDGKYFATLHPGGGWRATVVLRIARRQVFPEPSVPDRSIAGWMDLLPQVIKGLSEPYPVPGISIQACYQGAIACLGRRSMRAFRAAHRRRHRDEFAPLRLAVLEHYRLGVRDFEATIVPAP